MKLGKVVWGRKTKIEFVGGQNPIILPLFYLQFSPNCTTNAFSMGRSKHCIDARWPIVVVNTSHDAPRWPLEVPYQKIGINPNVLPKLPKLYPMQLQWECAYLTDDA